MRWSADIRENHNPNHYKLCKRYSIALYCNAISQYTKNSIGLKACNVLTTEMDWFVVYIILPILELSVWRFCLPMMIANVLDEIAMKLMLKQLFIRV